MFYVHRNAIKEIGMYFFSDKLDRRIKEIGTTIYQESLQIHDFFVKEGNDKNDAANVLDLRWRKAKDTEEWGGFAKYQWFRTTLTIPEAWKDGQVALVVETPGDIAWKVSAEYTAYLDGKLICGLDVFHHELPITSCAKKSEIHELALMGFSGYNERRPVISCRLVLVNQFVKDYYYNLKVAFECTQQATVLDSPENLAITELVDRSINLVDFRVLGSKMYYTSLEKANALLVSSLYQKMHSDSKITVSAIGHSHLDIAWLWRLEQSKEKAARAFGTVDRLMDRFPDFTFIQSQPQLYAYTKDNYPELYQRVKKRVAEKRLQPEGGMWVEADCNLISGESMIRQFLVGKQFFQEEFGLDNEILWLPDVFGYNAAMPQILKGCGINYFMTIKISWNQFNHLPMDTFYLQGIDGSKVLTHFMTTPTASKEGHRKALPYQKTYNGELCPETISHGWDTYQQKAINQDLLMAFGYGDGGGGPDDEMLENGERLKDFPGMPKLKWELPTTFFERLEKQVEGKDIPTWVGELYLEFHRGVYTSMARNKRYNRKSEFLYQDVEAFSVLAKAMVSHPYPQSQLQDNWKVILLNQFHDIIPGSSIKAVYEDSLAQYETVVNEGNQMENKALQAMISQISCKEDTVVVFNPNSAFTSSLVTLVLDQGVTSLTDDEGKVCLVQKLEDGTSIFFAEDVPQYGYKSYLVGKEKLLSKSSISVTKTKMENKFFRIRFDEKGEITEIYDKRNNREVMPKNTKGNVLLSFEDKPINYNAWDIDIFYQEKCWPVDDVRRIDVKEVGNVVGTLTIERKYLESTIVQDICIYENVPQIDFKTTVDWKQQEILLKASFPVDVNSSRATYEIQFGTVERNTHQNTSWDVAKFEVCAHKWVDLSQNDWGVSLMNDCKYGHDIHGNVMRLTLLKSGIYPNPDADKEKHCFTYSLYPHQGSWVDAKTTNQAYALNNPMIARECAKHDGVLPRSVSFVSVDNDNIIIETVKKAEIGDSYIVRMYECANTRAEGTLCFMRPLASLAECNMIEQEDRILNCTKNEVKITLRPYEIKTLRISF